MSEAVHVAKAAGGSAPIRTVWTREDDMRGGYYRPMWLHRVRVGLDGGGAPVSWRQTIVGQSIVAGTPFEGMMVKNGVDQTSVEGAADSPYVKATPNHLVDLHSPRTVDPGPLVALGRTHAHGLRHGDASWTRSLTKRSRIRWSTAASS